MSSDLSGGTGPFRMSDPPPGLSNDYAIKQQDYERYSQDLGNIPVGILNNHTVLSTRPQPPALSALTEINHTSPWAMVKRPAGYDVLSEQPLTRYTSPEFVKTKILPAIDNFVANCSAKDKEAAQYLGDLFKMDILVRLEWGDQIKGGMGSIQKA